MLIYDELPYRRTFVIIDQNRRKGYKKLKKRVRKEGKREDFVNESQTETTDYRIPLLHNKKIKIKNEYPKENISLFC